MKFYRGLKPALLFVFTLFAAAPVAAQHNVPLTLAEAEDRALAGEPGHAALLARAAALEGRQDHLDQRRRRLRRLQPEEGQPDGAAGVHAARAQALSTDRHAVAERRTEVSAELSA